jgi:hypothetical protein
MLGEAFTPALHRVRASHWYAHGHQPALLGEADVGEQRGRRQQTRSFDTCFIRLQARSFCTCFTRLQARSLARLRRKQTSGRRKRQTESISPSAASSLKFGDHGRCQLEKAEVVEEQARWSRKGLLGMEFDLEFSTYAK